MTIKVGYLQFAPIFGEVRKNVNKITQILKNADADIIVLPELPFTGYHFGSPQELLEVAEDPKRSTTIDTLVRICSEQNCSLVTGFAERVGDKVFNSALLIGTEGIISIYRKLHLFKNEKEFFIPGDLPLKVVEVKGVRIGMMVCFDWVFPEVARSLALQGAELLCHPSNLVLTYCQQTMLSRCIENGVFAITANRWGYDERPHGRLNFTGQSQIVSPKGELLHRGAGDRDELFVVEINPADARMKSITDRNDLFKDRRPEFYGALFEKEGSL